MSVAMKVARAAVLSAAMAGALVTAGAAAPADKVRVGVYTSISDAGLFIAQDKKYFAEQGLDVEFSHVESGALLTTQLASGDLDASGGAPEASLFNAARQDIAIKIVSDKGSSLPGHGYFAFVVRKDLADKIKTAADLRGRVLAVTGLNTGASSEATIARLLGAGGVKPSEVNIVNMSFGDILASLGSGRVDVGVLVEPLVTLAVEKGVGVVWKRADEIYPGQQYGVLVYGQGIIKRPDVARRFMVAYLKGARFYNDALSGKASRDELVSILIRNTPVKRPELYQSMVFPGLDPDGALNLSGLEDDEKWMVSSGRLKEMVAVSRLVDGSYAADAVKQLGPYH